MDVFTKAPLDRSGLWQPKIITLLLLLSIAQAGCSSDMSYGMTHIHILPPAAVNLATTTPVDLSLPPFSAKGCTVRYHWEDFRGVQLTAAALLDLGQSQSITPPAGVQGYLDLVLQTDCDQLKETEGFVAGRRDAGIALLPEKALPIQSSGESSPFGMVHAVLDDPYLGPWIKTLTWHTTGAKWWRYEIDKRAAKGFRELPIINGETWESDDSKPVSTTQLTRITERAGDYFKADPDVKYWELGLEENLTDQYNQPYYWPNLVAKVKAVREAAATWLPDIKLIYQIATVDPVEIKPFVNSVAAGYFDILSIHPYAWPDFPTPDRWLEHLIQASSALLQAHDLHMPIWFTEVGAPHQGNAPGRFFGYPEEGRAVTGLSRYKMAGYVVKLHAIALNQGIGKIFWYNYHDRDVGSKYAENFFGLVDYYGYPRPAYVAYTRMVSCLGGHKAGRKLAFPGNLIAYEFNAASGKVFIAWNTGQAPQTLKLNALGVSDGENIRITDLMGTPIAAPSGSLTLSSEPVFIATGDSVDTCS